MIATQQHTHIPAVLAGLAVVYKDHGWPFQWGQKTPKAVFVG